MTSIRQPVSRAWGMGVGAWDNIAFTITWAREHTALLILGFAGFLGFLWIGTSPWICGLLIAGLYALGGWLWWTELRHTDTPRQHLARVLLPPTLLATFALAGMWLALVSLMALVALVAVLYAQEPETEDERWWSEANLTDLLFGPFGLLAKRPEVSLSWKGQPRHDDSGTTITVALPGFSWEAVQAKRRDLAAVLCVPLSHLDVSHDKGQPENVVTIAVRTPPEQVTGSLSPLARVTATDATQPVRIGIDEDTGEVLYLDNDEANDLIAGVPGAGKTELVRLILAAYLLDPRAVVYGLDGKGARKDYKDAARLAARWVWGTDEDAPTALLVMLREVLALVRDRNERDDGATDWPPVLLLLEELQDVRAGADKADQEAIDETLGRIVRMGRAVRVKLVISTQRTSVDDLPSKVRNLITQRIALRTLQPADFALVLGITGPLEVRKPERKQGQGILRSPSGLHALVPDRMPLEQWRALCAAAEPVPVSLVKDEPQAPVTLRDAAFDLLREGPMLAGALYDALPPEVRPANASWLGRKLRPFPEFLSQEGRSGTTWSLTVASQTALTRSEGR